MRYLIITLLFTATLARAQTGADPNDVILDANRFAGSLASGLTFLSSASGRAQTIATQAQVFESATNADLDTIAELRAVVKQMAQGIRLLASDLDTLYTLERRHLRATAWGVQGAAIPEEPP